MLKIGMALLLAGFLASTAVAQGDAEKAKEKGTTAESLVGEWTMVSVEKGGEKKTGDEVGDQICTFTKDTMKQTLAGMTFGYKYTLDNSKSPTRIKLEVTESPFGAGSTADGIIEVKGDEMKLAYSTEGGQPESFDTEKAAADIRFCVLKRKK